MMGAMPGDLQVETRYRVEDDRRLPFLSARFPPHSVALSSAAVGGGYGPRDWVINAQVPLGYARTDLVAHIDELRELAGLPATDGVGLLTGAYVDRATTAREAGVHVVSTVGISEPEWAASRTPIARAAPRPGTINIVAWVPVALSAGALANAIITITEAKTQAMVEAGIVRLRPILMTAFSTVAGIVPIAIGFGAGAESRRPMGIAVVGGMMTSTFLTLLIIPVVYTVFSDLAERLRRKPHVLPQPANMEEVPAK